MENRTNWALLARYVAGECSSDEEQTVKAWIRADPSRKQLVTQLRRLWDATEEPPTDPPDDQLDMEAEWTTMKAKMDANSRTESGSTDSREDRSPERSPGARRRHRRGRLTRMVGAAAAVLLLIGGLWLVQSTWMSSTPEGTAFRQVVTKPGERAQIQLTDGSTVMLNVDSKLRLSNPFTQEKRVVHLTGQAYFEVEADESRPFIVRTDDASVQVHGTAFDVRGYPDDEQVQVAVTEGGVSLHPEKSDDADQGVKLTSGEIGWLTRKDPKVVTQKTDVGAYIGWTEGRLIFENTPLPKVAVRLERWYNIDVKIQEASLDSLRLTANLKSESIENVLDVITASLGIEYRIGEHAVVLSSRAPSD